MNSFILLFIKLIPFYFIAFIGYLIARIFKINIEKIGKVYLYILLPPVVFYGVQQVSLFSAEMFAPILYFLIAAFMSLASFIIGKKLLKTDTAYLLAITASINNIGYIGIPLSVALFGTKAIGPAVLTIAGSQLYFNTIGYFIASRGNYSTREAFIKTIKLPSLYALILGVIVQLIHIDLSKSFLDTVLNQYVNIYNILGLLLVGVGVASIKKESMDKMYLALSLIASIIIWPLIVWSIMYFDKTYFHMFSQLGRRVLFLQSLAPIGVSVITVAAAVKLYPEKAALAVAVSTISAVIYIPIMLSLFLHFL